MRRPKYLLQGPTGLYYVRARVPHALRQHDPELPLEVRVPTGVRNRRIAARIAREVLRRLNLRMQPLPTSRTWDAELIHTQETKYRAIPSKRARAPIPLKATTQEALMMVYRMCSWQSAFGGDGSGRFEVEPGDPPEIRRILLRAIDEARRLSEAAAESNASTTTAAIAPINHAVTPASANGGTPAVFVPPQPFLPAAAALLAPATNHWLFDAVLAFRDFHIQRNLWNPTTWVGTYEPTLRICRELLSHQTRSTTWTELGGRHRSEVISDIPLGGLHHALIVQLANDLLRFPRRHGKRRTAKDAKLILAGAGTPQSMRNALKMLERFATFLRFAADNGYISAALARQAAVLSRGGADDEGGARAFDLPRLKKIFESLSYRDDTFKRAYCYWSPPLAAFTGGRLAELAGLTVDDFIDVNGIPCVWFRDTPIVVDGVTYERRVKTKAGVRKVPLHPTLIALGLLDYVAARKAAGAVLLFDGLTYSEKSQWSRNIGQWFQKYATHMGFHQERTFVFHSFRSTFYQTMRDQGLDDVYARLTLGHEVKTIAGRFYSTDADGNFVVPIPVVYAAIAKMDYGVTFHRSRRWSGQPQLRRSLCINDKNVT
jgi:integrase